MHAELQDLGLGPDLGSAAMPDLKTREAGVGALVEPPGWFLVARGTLAGPRLTHGHRDHAAPEADPVAKLGPDRLPREATIKSGIGPPLGARDLS